MSSLLEIMDKKSCGKWYAYEQSAFYLSRMMLELSLDRYVMENALWLDSLKRVQSEIREEMVSDWALLFIGWREIGFTISFNVSWAAFAIMFEDMLKDATVKEIEDYF